MPEEGVLFSWKARAQVIFFIRTGTEFEVNAQQENEPKMNRIFLILCLSRSFFAVFARDLMLVLEVLPVLY
jgi:hypothetical protein